MFSMKRGLKNKVLRMIVKHRKRIPYTMPYHEPIVHIIGLNDPYALLTLANSPTYHGNTVMYRMISDVFFDQQYHAFMQSSDVVSLLLVLYLFHLKLSLEKQQE